MVDYAPLLSFFCFLFHSLLPLLFLSRLFIMVAHFLSPSPAHYNSTHLSFSSSRICLSFPIILYSYPRFSNYLLISHSPSRHLSISSSSLTSLSSTLSLPFFLSSSVVGSSFSFSSPWRKSDWWRKKEDEVFVSGDEVSNVYCYDLCV